MLKTLKRLNNGLGSARRAETEADGTDEEAGDWHYLVVDVAGMRPREEASYTKDSKRTDLDRVKEGTVVRVDRRRRAGWTRWLRLASGEGWLFDVSPKDKKVRMVEVEVLSGDWHYQACSERVPVLPKPSMHLAAMKTSKRSQVLEYKEAIVVKERVRPVNGKGSFLRLGDGRGWVLDFANGQKTLQRCQGSNEAGPNSSNDGGAASSEVGVADISPQDLDEPEFGKWDYVVLDPKGICLRSSPTYDKNAKLQQRLEDGELVRVVERRVGHGTTFLRVDHPQGWVFDVQPGTGNSRHQRLAEVQLELGPWFYRVCARKGVALRSRLSFSNGSKVGPGPNEGALVPVSQRCKIGKTMFLKLRDEIGWIFDAKNDKVMVEGPVAVEQPPDVAATVAGQEGVYLLSAPTHLTWAVTKRLLLPGACAQVTHMCSVENCRWAHVAQSGSMAGWLPCERLEMVRGGAALGQGQRGAFDPQRVRAALDAPSARPW